MGLRTSSHCRWPEVLRSTLKNRQRHRECLVIDLGVQALIKDGGFYDVVMLLRDADNSMTLSRQSPHMPRHLAILLRYTLVVSAVQRVVIFSYPTTTQSQGTCALAGRCMEKLKRRRTQCYHDTNPCPA